MIAFERWLHGRDYKTVDLGEGESLLFIVGNHRLFRISSELAAKLRDGLEGLSGDELDEWNRLSEAGLLSEVNAPRVASAAFGDGANLAINVNLTAVCNLGCTYCFAEGGDYGRIKGKLTSLTVDDIFAFIEEHVTPTQTVRFEFFGGEPLLNFERIAEICERSDEFERRHGIRFINRISTNLTKLPQGAAELFAAKRFIVSVSIDGGQVTHDRNRPTKGGKGSWAGIIENCKRVRAASDDITMVARMTVMGGYPLLIDNVRELWELNLFDYFQIYPGVTPAERDPLLPSVLGDTAPAPAEQGGTMANDFLEQFTAFVGEYSSFFTPTNRFRGVLEYERIVEMVLDGKAAISFCSGGRNYFTFSPDDSVMPCHRLVGEPQFAVPSDPEGFARAVAPWRLPIDNHPVCSDCWVRYICAGGCKQENFIATGDLNDPNREGCDYQRSLVENVIGMLGRQGEEYRGLPRGPLDDLFISCGRPTLLNLRESGNVQPETLHHFHVM